MPGGLEVGYKKNVKKKKEDAWFFGDFHLFISIYIFFFYDETVRTNVSQLRQAVHVFLYVVNIQLPLTNGCLVACSIVCNAGELVLSVFPSRHVVTTGCAPLPCSRSQSLLLRRRRCSVPTGHYVSLKPLNFVWYQCF